MRNTPWKVPFDGGYGFGPERRSDGPDRPAGGPAASDAEAALRESVAAYWVAHRISEDEIRRSRREPPAPRVEPVWTRPPERNSSLRSGLRSWFRRRFDPVGGAPTPRRRPGPEYGPISHTALTLGPRPGRR